MAMALSPRGRSDTAALALGNNAGGPRHGGRRAGRPHLRLPGQQFHPRLVSAWVLFFGLLTSLLYAYLFKNPILALVLALGVGMAADGGIAAYYADQPARLPHHRARHRRSSSGSRSSAAAINLYVGRFR